MKKIFSAVMAIVLVLSVIPFNAFATQDNISSGIDMSKYTNSELDLTQYTIDDLMNMSFEEYSFLVKEFERVYDPYGTYVEETETLQNTEESISPLWTSGDVENDEWVEVGSHEQITSTACSILIRDKGFYGESGDAVAIALMISVASLYPDKDEVGAVIFSGHFYDPDTQKNYAGSTTNTARTNAVSHYNAAVSAANVGDMEEAYEHIGRCLHYVQDANEPHHAANITAVNLSHGNFESYAFDNIEAILGSYTSISSSYYTTASNTSVSNLVHNAAVSAKSYANTVNNALNTSQWYSTANVCLKSAARYSAMIMYKFGLETSVPFYYN